MTAPLTRVSRIGVLWLPIMMFWGGLMTQLLPERVQHFAGAEKGTWLAVIGGGSAVLACVVQLVIGPVSDACIHPRGRRYPFIFWSLTLSSVPVLWFAFAGNLIELLLAFILNEICVAVACTPLQALIPDLVPTREQGKAVGWNSLYSSGGQILGLALAGLLLARGATNSLFHIHMPPEPEVTVSIRLFCGISLVVLYTCLFLHSREVHETPLPADEAPSWSTLFRQSFALRPSDYPDFFRLLLSRILVNAALYTCIEFVRYFVEEALPLNGQDLSVETMWLSLLPTVGGIFGAVLSGHYADRISKRKLIFAATAWTVVALVLFEISTSITMARLMAFLGGLGFGTLYSVGWAFATNLMPRGKEAWFTGIFYLAFSLPQILVYISGGLIGQAFGYRAVFWTIPVFLLLGAAVVAGVREHHEIPLPSVPGKAAELQG